MPTQQQMDLRVCQRPVKSTVSSGGAAAAIPAARCSNLTISTQLEKAGGKHPDVLCWFYNFSVSKINLKQNNFKGSWRDGLAVKSP